MTDKLLLTLALEQGEDGSWDAERTDAFIQDLLTDLNEIEAVRADAGTSEEMDAGSKSFGTFLLGVLTAVVNRDNALKVLRYLQSRLVDSPQPIKLKVTRVGTDGGQQTVELEGAAKDADTIHALLTRVEDWFQALP